MAFINKSFACLLVAPCGRFSFRRKKKKCRTPFKQQQPYWASLCFVSAMCWGSSSTRNHGTGHDKDKDKRVPVPLRSLTQTTQTHTM